MRWPGRRDVVEFIQRRFAGTAPSATARSPRPSWLPEAPAPVAAGQRPELIPVGSDDELVIPGSPSEVPTPPEYAEGESGVDLLAYYLPFHFHGRAWGIYLRASGVAYLAQVIKGGVLAARDGPYLRESRLVLFEHEFFHFRTEYAASMAEALLGFPRYREYFGSAAAPPVEEAMANASAIRRLAHSRHRVVRSAVAAWMSRQGPGYRDFGRYQSRRASRQGHQKLAGLMVIDGSVFLTSGRVMKTDLSSAPIYKLYEVSIAPEPRGVVPTWLVFDEPLPWLGVVRRLPAFNGVMVQVHAREHPPPHIHVHIPPTVRAPLTKLAWPELTPLKGQPYLSNRERKKLDVYLQVYAPEVEQEVRQKFLAITTK